MLNTESTVEAKDEDGKHRLVIYSSFAAALTVEMGSAKERDAWMNAINGVIAMCSGMLRGYIIKQGGLLSGGHKRLFFVLHKTGITCHHSHEKTADIMSTMYLHAGTSLVSKDREFVLQLVDKNQKDLTWNLQFDVSGDEYNLWKEKISGIVQTFMDVSDKGRRNSTFINKTKATAVFSGDLWLQEINGVKVEVGEDPCQAVLTMNEDDEDENTGALLVLMEPDVRVLGAHIFKQDVNITSACGVCETNKDDTFVIVTPQKIVKLQARGKQEKEQWIFIIREVIYDLRPDVSDPMLLAAEEMLNNPVFIDLKFEHKAPLGLSLERTGEWPVVESLDSSKMGSNLVVGDLLHATRCRNSNNEWEDVLLTDYDATMNKLVTWQPPLSLRFRQLPQKSGYLMKRSLAEASKWRTRYFSLSGGRLNYRRSEVDDNTIKGEIVLFGASVCLAAAADADGKLFCVRIQAGERGILIQAETEEERIEWAAALHHSAWILNGSSQIMYAQRKAEEEERERLMETEAEDARVLREAEEASRAEAEAAAQAEAEHMRAQAEEEAAAVAEAAAIAEAEAEEAAILKAQAQAAAEAAAEAAVPPPPPTAEEEEEYLDGLTIFELQEEATATRADLIEMFGSYSKIIKRQAGAIHAPGVAASSRESTKNGWGDDPRLMNPMGFVALYRLASAGRSKDLFREMKLFNSFDFKDRGHLDEQDFCDGWENLQVSNDPQVLRQLRELKKLTHKRAVTTL
jgi:hypothetical protein